MVGRRAATEPAGPAVARGAVLVVLGMAGLGLFASPSAANVPITRISSLQATVREQWGQAPVDASEVRGAARADHDLGGHRARSKRKCLRSRVTIDAKRPGALIKGTPGRDVIRGTRGDDQIVGRGGADRICGGRGDDLLLGDQSNADHRVRPGRDKISGGPGDDVINGGGKADLLLGNDGDFDGIQGETGPDIIRGGPGILDFVGYVNARSKIKVDLSEQMASGADGEDDVKSVEMVAGSPNDDTIVGDGEFNVIFGLQGDDDLQGGAGEDLVEFAFATSTVEVQLGSGEADGEGSDDLRGFEAVVGGDLRDVIVGDGKENWISGGSGNDDLAAAGGSDIVDGDGGDDLLDGGEADDQLAGGEGDDSLVGGTGADTATYATDLTGIAADLEIGEAYRNGEPGGPEDTFDGVENLQGTASSDYLAGSEGDNRLEGSGGEDILEGYGGRDALFGGDQADSLDGGASDDSLLGEGGANEFDGGEGDDICFNEIDSAGGATCETGAGGTPDKLPPPAGGSSPPARSTDGPVAGSLREFATSRMVGWSDYVSCGFGRITVFGPVTAQITGGVNESVAWRSILWQWSNAQGKWLAPKYYPWSTGFIGGNTLYRNGVANAWVYANPSVQTWTYSGSATWAVQTKFYWYRDGGTRTVNMGFDPYGAPYCVT